jgi:hypothetical protein
MAELRWELAWIVVIGYGWAEVVVGIDCGNRLWLRKNEVGVGIDCGNRLWLS